MFIFTFITNYCAKQCLGMKGVKILYKNSQCKKFASLHSNTCKPICQFTYFRLLKGFICVGYSDYFLFTHVTGDSSQVINRLWLTLNNIVKPTLKPDETRTKLTKCLRIYLCQSVLIQTTTMSRRFKYRTAYNGRIYMQWFVVVLFSVRISCPKSADLETSIDLIISHHDCHCDLLDQF